MKKCVLWTISVSLMVLATYWFIPKLGFPSELVLEVGHSEIFSESEIKRGMEVIKSHFGFPNTALRKLSYDEEKAKPHIKSYLENNQNGLSESNLLIIFSEFYVDGTGENPVLTPDTVYENYKWVLIRDNENGPWEIDDQGY